MADGSAGEIGAPIGLTSEAAVMPKYSPRSRAERVIASLRVVLAVFSLAAIWFDPTEPAHYAEETYALLWLYVVYAAGLAVAAWTNRAPRAHLQVATHVVDLAIFSVLNYLTEGPSSPFFVYFVFALLCAALRWSWRATVWTAVGALTLFVAVGLYVEWSEPRAGSELNRFIIRGAYLAVVAAFLSYLGLYQEKVHRDIRSLAAWPRVPPTTERAPIEVLLAHATTMLESPRGVLVWLAGDEPWVHVACWSPRGFELTREPPDSLPHPLVEPALEPVSLLAGEQGRSIIYSTQDGFVEWPGSPFDEAFRTRFAVRAALSGPVRGREVDGRVFFLDKTGMTLDDLVLADIVARELAGSLDQHYLSERIREMAVAAERVRVSRDLHDGVLQSLTGARLQIQAVASELADAGDAPERLVAIERLIAAEQRELRSFIQQLRRAGGTETGDFHERIRDLKDRAERQWDLRVDLQVDVGVTIGQDLTNEVFLLVHEAIGNAARHGRATHLHVALLATGDRLDITVRDNGRGFPFHGRLDHVELERRRQGPVSLRERVVALRGTLVVESQPTGSAIGVSLPLEQGGT